jgi:hypothetical protein
MRLRAHCVRKGRTTVKRLICFRSMVTPGTAMSEKAALIQGGWAKRSEVSD